MALHIAFNAVIAAGADGDADNRNMVLVQPFDGGRSIFADGAPASPEIYYGNVGGVAWWEECGCA